MTYSVKEIYYTLQGEGAHSGRPAVFCRFAGCNLWSGLEPDRTSAICRFCDTQFVGTDGPGGGKFESAAALGDAVDHAWPSQAATGDKFVVLTGGEPLLQLDAAAIDALHDRGFVVAVETNGTVAAPAGIDWLTVSPKAGAPLVQICGNELKLVYHQPGAEPSDFEHLAFDLFYLQPMDGPDAAEMTRRAIAYCLKNPRWRLGLQTHKLLGIP